MNATMISTSPLLPWPLLAPLLAVAGIAMLLAALRGARGGVLRVAAGLVLAVALINPSLVREKRDPIRDIAVIAVDRSQSQSLGKRTGRTDAALADLKQKMAAFPDLETRVVTVGEDSDVTGQTDVFGPLEQAMADIPRSRMAGIVLLSDGEVHDVPVQPNELASAGPFHTLLSGERNERDRRITIVSAPAYGIVGKSVDVTLRVDDTPGINAASAAVTYIQDGGAPTTVDVPVGKDFQIDLPLDHEGRSIATFDAAPVEGELTLANNRTAVAINAVRDRLKVLLVSGEPYPGERTWRNLLKADPSVDLVHFTILRPPEKQDMIPVKELSLIAFPIKELFEVKLKQFDLIIFDRYKQMGILPQRYYENIAQYVRDGGALLDASGPALTDPMSLFYTPVGDVLPSNPVGDDVGRFQPTVTALGRRHPVTALLPGDAGGKPSWGSWFRQVDVAPKSTDPNDTAVVMAGSQGKPLLLLSHVGQGRVAQLTSDQIWLWSRGYDGGGPQAELLRRLAHWLMKEPALEENDLRARVDGATMTVDRVSLIPGGPDVTVTAPSGATETVKLADKGAGVDSGTVPAKETGVYTVSDGKKTIYAIAGALDSPEFRDVLTTEEKLKPVAEATGGGIHWLAEYPSIDVRRVPAGRSMNGSSWIGLRANGQYTVSGVDQTPLLPPIAVLVLAVAALLWGWRREGK
jgi:hypothetical protein